MDLGGEDDQRRHHFPEMRNWISKAAFVFYWLCYRIVFFIQIPFSRFKDCEVNLFHFSYESCNFDLPA